MKLTEVKFHGKQEEFFRAGPQPTLFLAGVGAGKTWVGILKLIKLLDEYPGSRGVIIRQRFSQLKKTTAATLRQLLPRDQIARRNDNEGVIVLKNGSELLLMHLDKPDSIDNLKSLELNFAYIDQMEDIREEAWDTLIERLGRWTGATRRGGYPADWLFKTSKGECIPPPYAFASCYSPGYDNWITRRWWKHGEEREKYKQQGYLVLQGSTRDNPHLTSEYIKGRLAMGKEYVERFVDAETWGANEGRIFYLAEESILEPTPDLVRRIRYTMKLHRVLDPGDYTTTACLWYATDNNGNVFFYKEYGRDNALVSEHRRAIWDLSKEDGASSMNPPVYYTNIADPVIANKTRGRGIDKPPQWSMQDEWSDRHVMEPETAIYWQRANNDESMTISRVREYLKIDPKHRHPVTGKLGSPRAFFVARRPGYPNGMYETLRDIRSAKRKEVGMNSDGTKQFGDERDPEVRDHYLDCVRYAIGMRPALGPDVRRMSEEPGVIRLDEYYRMSKEVDDFNRLRGKREPVKDHSWR